MLPPSIVGKPEGLRRWLVPSSRGITAWGFSDLSTFSDTSPQRIVDLRIIFPTNREYHGTGMHCQEKQPELELQ